jgi:hypothetical protein
MNLDKLKKWWAKRPMYVRLITPAEANVKHQKHRARRIRLLGIPLPEIRSTLSCKHRGGWKTALKENGIRLKVACRNCGFTKAASS